MILILLTLTACDEENGEDEMPENPASIPSNELPDEYAHLPLLDQTVIARIRENPVVFHQLNPVSPGEELVVLHTNHGDITLRFFPEDAPMAVENFLTHARNGYYDNVIFHRVLNNFMIQGGDPTGTGHGGESIFGEPFGIEPSFNLRHFRGALAMAHAGGRSMGSQFYIVQNPSTGGQHAAMFRNMLGNLDEPIGRFSDGTIFRNSDVHSREELEYFLNNGGTPHLDWLWNNDGHTVFGHVVEGMDVVDSIARTDADRNGRPDEDVIIERVSFIIAD